MKNLATLLFLLFSAQVFCQLSDNDSLTFLRQSKQYNLALTLVNEILSKPIEIDTIRRGFLHEKGFIFEHLSEPDSALNCYLEVLNSSPNFTPSINGAASIYGEFGQYDKAYLLFAKIRNKDQNDILPLSNIIYFKGLEGNYNDAIIYADTAMVIAKDSIVIALVLNNRGYAKLKIGKLTEALEDINKSLNYLPNNSYAYRNKALIYIENEELDDACLALQKAKDLGAVNMTKELIDNYCR
jgi:tetratricopeptide (TPR) repeat protein